MHVHRRAPSNHAPQDWFTGDVFYEELMVAPEPGRLRLLSVHFAPGARSWWHTHPTEQIIHVTEGTCLAQIEGEPVRTIATGESVWFPPGTVSWHGAAPDTFMTHIATQDCAEDGSTVTWLRPVTDAEYAG